MSDYAWLDRFLKHERYREAIASVSLSHPADCVCVTCRAAGGDKQAFREAVETLELEQEMRERKR